MLTHSSAYLVTPRPCGLIGDSQIVLNLPGGASGGAGCNHKDRPEPIPQWFSGLMKDRIGSQRCMVLARFALIDSPGGDEIRLVMAAPRAAEAIRPLALGEIVETVFFGSKTTSKLPDSHGGIHELSPLQKALRGPSIYNGL